MYLLTKEENSIESGAFASIDNDGTTIIQFFIDKDDAMCYSTHLEAIGQELYVTETKDDNIDTLCDVLGYAYTIVEPGQVVIPRIETQHDEIFNS